MTNIVVGLIGLAIGVALGWLIAQLRTSQRIAEATSAARVATERLEAAEKIATDRDALATQFKAYPPRAWLTRTNALPSRHSGQ